MIRKAPIYRLSRRKAPKTLQTCDKNQWNFLLYDTGASDNFANLGIFTKVFIPVHIYNSLIYHCYTIGVILFIIGR